MEETNSVNGKVEDDENIKQRDSQTPLTVPSQTPGIETNENETLLGQECEGSPDLFKRTSVEEADSQPKETEENTAAAEVAEERSVSHHPMTTRSKSSVLYRGTTSRSHKSLGKRNSLRSLRSDSTLLSHRSAHSDSQSTGLFNTMKTNQFRRIELEKKQQEETLLQESREQEELELEWGKLIQVGRDQHEKRFLEEQKRLREEEKRLREEKERIREEKEEQKRQHEAEKRAFQQKCEEIHHKRKQEMERLHRRRIRDLQELGNRSQGEQLEALAEQGLANTSSIKIIDRPLNKLAQVALTPSANSNAVPAIAMPDITTGVQFSMPLQPMTCIAANQQNRIMSTSNAAAPNSGPAVNVDDSYPSSKTWLAIVDGTNAGRNNSIRSETLRKMKNLGMDVDKLNVWRVIVNPDGVSTTCVNRNMDRGCLICSSQPLTETRIQSEKVKINSEKRLISELDKIELSFALTKLEIGLVVWYEHETLQLFVTNLARYLTHYRITSNLDPQPYGYILPKKISAPIFSIKKFVDLIEKKKQEGGQVTGEEGLLIYPALSNSPVDSWLHGYICPLKLHIIPEGILQFH